jgi:hypothetical protein
MSPRWRGGTTYGIQSEWIRCKHSQHKPREWRPRQLLKNCPCSSNMRYAHRHLPRKYVSPSYTWIWWEVKLGFPFKMYSVLVDWNCLTSLIYSCGFPMQRHNATHRHASLTWSSMDTSITLPLLSTTTIFNIRAMVIIVRPRAALSHAIMVQCWWQALLVVSDKNELQEALLYSCMGCTWSVLADCEHGMHKTFQMLEGTVAQGFITSYPEYTWNSQCECKPGKVYLLASITGLQCTSSSALPSLGTFGTVSPITSSIAPGGSVPYTCTDPYKPVAAAVAASNNVICDGGVVKVVGAPCGEYALDVYMMAKTAHYSWKLGWSLELCIRHWSEVRPCK